MNSFDAIRLFAAVLVLWGHSYALTGSGPDFLSRLSQGLDGLSGLGVLVFFVVSGFLVTRSAWERNCLDYVVSRMARIVPALIPLSALQVMLGGVLTTYGFREYIFHEQTIRALLNFRVFNLGLGLPGVFSGLPVVAVNGSLWTLPIESGFYLVLLAFFDFYK